MQRITLLTLFICSFSISFSQTAFFVSPLGNDNGTGSLAQPWETLQYAANQVAQGDTIFLRQGIYAGDVTVTTDDITIRSYPSEWAVVSASTSDPNAQQALWFNAAGGRVLDLELEGGYFYCLKFEQGNAFVSNCRIHGSGRDCIKIVPDADNITIEDSEIYDSGQRDNSNAEGVDNVNADNMVIRRCFIHDIATNGAYAKGGAIGCVMENNLVMNCGGGLLLGFFTDLQFFDPVQNPNFHGSIDGVIRNNYIIGTDGPGIGMFAALRPQVVHNTLLDVAESSRGGLHFEPVTNDGILRYVVDPVVVNNIVTLSATASRTLVEDRNNGMTGAVVLHHNRYHDADGNDQFRYGGGVVNFAGWQGAVPGGDANSTLGDPLLDGSFHLQSGSPCVGTGDSGFATIDYDGGPRDAAPDIGADEYHGNCANAIPPTGLGTGAACDSLLTHLLPPVPATSMQLFPNPAQKRISILFNGGFVGQTGHFSVLDAFGRTVSQGQMVVGSISQIDLSQLSEGLYWVRVEVSGGRFVKRLLVKE